MSTSRSSALIDSSCTGYRPCTRRRPSLQQQGPPVHSSVTHGAAVRDVAPPTVAGAAFPACAGRTAAFSISIPRARVHPCAWSSPTAEGDRVGARWSVPALRGLPLVQRRVLRRAASPWPQPRSSAIGDRAAHPEPFRRMWNVAPPAFNVSVVIPISFATASRVRRRSAALGCCDPARCVLRPAGAPGGGCRSASLAGSSAAPR